MCYEKRDPNIARLSKERDELIKALEDIINGRDHCLYCKYCDGKHCTHEDGKCCGDDKSFWEWRGVGDG